MKDYRKRTKPFKFWEGRLETLTIINENVGVGVSITHDEEKVLHQEELEPSDWEE